MSGDIRETLAESVCMCLRSFRKDGTPVDTPIWVTRVGDCFVSYTDDRSFKFKRVRNNPKVEIAVCDGWGLCSTPFYPGVCRIVEAEDERVRYFDAMKKKYGFNWTMAWYGSLLTDRIKHRVVLEAQLTQLTPIGGAADYPL